MRDRVTLSISATPRQMTEADEIGIVILLAGDLDVLSAGDVQLGNMRNERSELVRVPADVQKLQSDAGACILITTHGVFLLNELCVI